MPPFILMIWPEVLSSILGNFATALSVIAVMSQYLKYSHRKIGEEAVKWNDLNRDLAHLKRNKDAYKTFVNQVSEEIHEIELLIADVQGQIKTIDRNTCQKDTNKKIENILSRLAKLEAENNIILSRQFGMEST